jgi:hypothetical protein
MGHKSMTLKIDRAKLSNDQKDRLLGHQSNEIDARIKTNNELTRAMDALTKSLPAALAEAIIERMNSWSEANNIILYASAAGLQDIIANRSATAQMN